MTSGPAWRAAFGVNRSCDNFSSRWCRFRLRSKRARRLCSEARENRKETTHLAAHAAHFAERDVRDDARGRRAFDAFDVQTRFAVDDARIAPPSRLRFDGCAAPYRTFQLLRIEITRQRQTTPDGFPFRDAFARPSLSVRRERACRALTREQRFTSVDDDARAAIGSTTMIVTRNTASAAGDIFDRRENQCFARSSNPATARRATFRSRRLFSAGPRAFQNFCSPSSLAACRICARCALGVFGERMNRKLHTSLRRGSISR